MPEHEQSVYPLTDLKCFTVSFTYLSSTLRPWPFCINVCLFLAAPSFVEELLDQAAAAGQCVTLSCRTAPHSSLHIRWFRGELAAPRVPPGQGWLRHLWIHCQGTYFSYIPPCRWDASPQQQSDPHLVHTQALPAVNYSLCQC